MAMNRETKRMLQKQGQLGEDGAPARRERRQPTPPRQAEREKRTRPTEFIKEVRSELRKVAWPTRAETTNYATIVFMTLVFIILLIFLFDLVFAKGVFFLFDT